MKVQFYGNITTPEIIRKSIADVYLQGGGLADSDVNIEKITVTPSPLSTIGLADSDFGFSTDINILNERDVDVDPYVADGYVETGYFRETV
jgi:hypothetical protein